MILRRLHLAVGVGGVIAFVLTGQYMRRVLDMASVVDLPRMLYRSAHIHLLFASLLKLLLGFYLAEGPDGWRKWVRRAGSVPILLAPLLFVMAFATEPQLSSFSRPYAIPAVEACLLGAILHTISRARIGRLDGK